MMLRKATAIETCCPSPEAWERRLSQIREAFTLAKQNGLTVWGLFEGDLDADVLVVTDSLQSAIEIISDAYPDCWSCYTIALKESEFIDAPQRTPTPRELNLNKLHKIYGVVLRLKIEVASVKLRGEQRHVDAIGDGLAAVLDRIVVAMTPTVRG